MRRLIGFTTLGGTVVGAATGAVFTPFGVPFGLVAGAVLGLLSGWCTAGLSWVEGPDPSLDAVRLMLTAPPLVLLALAATGLGLWSGGSAVIAGVSVVVAAPLSAAVTLIGAPWALARLRPMPDEFPRPTMIRPLLVPLYFLAFAVAAWLVYFGILSMQ